MKFFQSARIMALGLALFLHLARLAAQPAMEGTDDFMRQTGKIWVVVAVVLTVFIGLVWYLWRLDKHLTKVEHQTFSDNER